MRGGCDMITTTLSTYPGKKVVKDLGIVFAYDDAVRPTRLAINRKNIWKQHSNV